jgi:hypothetical protein
VNNACQAGPSACRNSLDCVGAPNPVCDIATGACVQCVIPNDCPDNNDCTDHLCVPYVPCVNSLDCISGLICDTSVGRCVECVASQDCDSTRTCVGNSCRPICESDNQCTPLGLLCNRNVGYCVECLRHEDCTESRHCASGACKTDVCTPGAQRCENNAVYTCDAAGSGWGTPSFCGSLQTCKQTTSSTSCQNWICTPSTSQCDTSSERVMQCSADGLAQALKEDCGSQVCVAATCKPVICSAGTRRCSGNLVLQCSPKGDAETTYDTCTTAEYCDDVTKTCVTKICTPDAPACNGTFATTCNSIGSGYTGASTNPTAASRASSVCKARARTCCARRIRTSATVATCGAARPMA